MSSSNRSTRYVDEHLDDQQAILYFLRRYKHRCEWFHAERLRQAVRHDTHKGEKTLALDLYEYMHDQGIDFHIEPHSTSGIPDFVADQIGSSFHEKLYNRGSAHTTLLALGAPPRH